MERFSWIGPLPAGHQPQIAGAVKLGAVARTVEPHTTGARGRFARENRAMNAGEPPRGEGKASDALMELARPWVESLGPGMTKAERRAALTLVSHVWNSVVLDRVTRPGTVEAMRAVLRNQGAPREMLRVFDELVARKRAESVRDDRVIVGVDLVGALNRDERVRVQWGDAAGLDFDRALAMIAELAGRARESASDATSGGAGNAKLHPRDSTASEGAKRGRWDELVAKRTLQGPSQSMADYLNSAVMDLSPAASSAVRRKALDFALGVWNTVVSERHGIQPDSVRRLRERIAERGDAGLLERFERLVARKRAEAPADDNVLMDVDMRLQGGLLKLRIHCCEAPPADDLDGVAWLEQLSKQHLRATLPTRRRTTARRSPPQPAARVGDAWGELYERAAAFYELAPWRWLDDSELFGVRLPGEREVHWVCVMGAAGSLFGLAVYDGDAGFEAHRQVQADEVETPEAAYGVDGWLVTFVPRAELSPPELARAVASGVKFASAKAWPQFERTLFGKLPRAIEEHQVARVRFLIERAIEATLERAHNPELFAPAGGGARKVWTVVGGAPRTETSPPGTPPRPNFAPVDRGAVKRLMRSSARRGEAFEFDVQPWLARVADESGGEFLPAAAALVDSRSGSALGVKLLRPEERYAKAAEQLVAILSEAAAIPREVRVRRAWVREAVKPTLDALGVRTAFADELPMLAHFTAAMAERMAQEAPRD